MRAAHTYRMDSSLPRILILGAHGGLGRALTRHLAPRFEVTAWTRAELDVTDARAIASRLAAQPFDVLLNTSGITRPDDCEEHPERARVVNAEAPRHLARACRIKGARLIHFSTGYVFDGESRRMWAEDDPAVPVNCYGRTKLEGELAVLAEHPGALVARVTWLFGPDKDSHPDQMIARALHAAEIRAADDTTSSPTFTQDLCVWIEHLITHHPQACGLLHLCNSGSTSWHGWAQAALEIAVDCGAPLRTTRVTPAPLSSVVSFKARRPPHTGLLTDRFTQITGLTPRPWREALADHIASKQRLICAAAE